MLMAGHTVLNIFLVYTTTFSQGQTNHEILCTDSLTCNEHHRSWWLQMRIHVNNILHVMQHNQFEQRLYGELDDDRSYEYSLKMRYILCKEKHSMAFMLDSRSDQWPVRCLWTGNAMNGTCAPAPPSNLSIYYIAPNKWRQQVREFRIKIGCNLVDIQKANNLDELYACKERCIQAGIGYLPSMFIMTALLVSFTLLLLT